MAETPEPFVAAHRCKGCMRLFLADQLNGSFSLAIARGGLRLLRRFIESECRCFNRSAKHIAHNRDDVRTV